MKPSFNILATCLSRYIEQAQNLYGIPLDELNPDEEKAPTQKLVDVFTTIVKHSIQAKEHKLAIGVAIEARRSDLIVETINHETVQRHKYRRELVEYAIDCVVNFSNSKPFIVEVLNRLVHYLFSLRKRDYFLMARIMMMLEDLRQAYTLFKSLVDPRDTLYNKFTAYQIAYDMAATCSQNFLVSLQRALSREDAFLLKVVHGILLGVNTVNFDLTFLADNHDVDYRILHRSLALLDMRASLCHSAVSIQAAYMYFGTTVDFFVRNRPAWVQETCNWNRFTAVAALGVMNYGNIYTGFDSIKDYLPMFDIDKKEGLVPPSPYAQGGALYAIGLMYGDHGDQLSSYLEKKLATETGVYGYEDEVIRHGNCLGLGLCNIATRNKEVYKMIEEVLEQNLYTSGSAAGLALGLIMLGSANDEKAVDMLDFAAITEQESITRSLTLSLAFVFYLQGSGAEDMIDTLLEVRNPIMRYGGAFTIALAYAGTQNTKAIQRLLQLVISDASDDVRRAAGIGLGFLFIRNHTALPALVCPLAESHNPHVRYGVALALGIACAGTGFKDAFEILDSLLKDEIPFVTQGAMLAVAMILIQQNEETFPTIDKYTDFFEHSIASLECDPMVHFGAALAKGILNAGGRNVTIALKTPLTLGLNAKAVVGMAVFVQYWYWHPLAHFLMLSFKPTTLIAVTEYQGMPKLDFPVKPGTRSYHYAKTSMPSTIMTTQMIKKAETAVLSTTRREAIRARTRTRKVAILSTTSREKDKAKPRNVAKMDEKEVLSLRTVLAKYSKKKKDKKPAEKPPSPEPDYLDKSPPSFVIRPRKIVFGEEDPIPNLTRVVPDLLPQIDLTKIKDFVPIQSHRRIGGVVMVFPRSPDFEPEYIETAQTKFDQGYLDVPVPDGFVYDSSKDFSDTTSDDDSDVGFVTADAVDNQSNTEEHGNLNPEEPEENEETEGQVQGKEDVEKDGDAGDEAGEGEDSEPEEGENSNKSGYRY